MDPNEPAITSDREDTRAFLTDLAALQAEIEGVSKDATNPHFKSQYADRTSIIRSLKPLLQKFNFVVTQVLVPPPVGQTDVLALATTLFHVPTGKSIGDTAVVPLPKSDPQGYGSAMTYTSRYALVALFVLPLLDDDDGNAASSAKGKQASGAGAFNQDRTAASSSSKPGTTTKKATSTSATSKATATTPAASTPATTTAAPAVEPAKTSSPASNATSPSDPTIDDAAVAEAEGKPAPVAANATKPVTTSLWGKK